MAAETPDTQWRAMLFCISIAVLFRVFNALSKDYTTVIQYPVNFTIEDKKLTFKEEPPKKIPIEFTGRGWALLRHQLRLYTSPVELPVARVARRGRVSHTRLYTLLSQHFQDLRVNKVLVNKLRIYTRPKPAEQPSS